MEWKKPVITKVELDPDQAVLGTCAQNIGYGAWMNGSFCVWGSKAFSQTNEYCTGADARGTWQEGYTDGILDNANAGS